MRSFWRYIISVATRQSFREKSNKQYTIDSQHIQNYRNLWFCDYNIFENSRIHNTKTTRIDDDEEKYDTPVTYTVNSAGFRMYERWGGPNKVACFGCSNTFGQGLMDHETWPYLLQDNLDSTKYTAYNYGLCGASADTISRLIFLYTQLHKPHAIICLFPDIFRKEYFTKNTKLPVNFCPFMDKKYIPSDKEYQSYIGLVNQYDGFFNFIKNIKFIETICNANNIRFYWHTWSPQLLDIDRLTIKTYFNQKNCLIKDDMLYDIELKNNIRDKCFKARDGAHNGEKYNSILSNEFAKMLLNNNK